MVSSRKASVSRPSAEVQSRTRSWTAGRSRPPLLEEETGPTCLSCLPHGPDAVRNLLLHYLACIEIHERADFRKGKHEFWDRKRGVELDKVRAENQTARDDERKDDGQMRAQADERVKKAIESLEVSITAQEKRTRILRKAIADAADAAQPPSPSLVACLQDSGKSWRACKEYAGGIKEVRRWRSSQQLHIDSPDAVQNQQDRQEPENTRPGVQKTNRGPPCNPKMTEGNDEYKLERDVNAYLIQYTQKLAPVAADETAYRLPDKPIYEQFTDDRFKDKFPDQRTSIDMLLESAHAKSFEPRPNILSKKNSDEKDSAMTRTTMRYLHIPANNMEVWIPDRPWFTSPICPKTDSQCP